MRSIRLATFCTSTLIAATAVAAPPREGPAPAVKPVRLTRDDLSKATDVMNRVAAAVEKDPSIVDDIPKSPEEHSTVDDVAARVEHSRLGPIFKQVGITPMQYVQTLMSVSNAEAYALRQQHGRAAAPDPVAAENAKLLQSNPDAMQSLQQAVERVRKLTIDKQR